MSVNDRVYYSLSEDDDQLTHEDPAEALEAAIDLAWPRVPDEWKPGQTVKVLAFRPATDAIVANYRVWACERSPADDVDLIVPPERSDS